MMKMEIELKDQIIRKADYGAGVWAFFLSQPLGNYTSKRRLDKF